MSDTIIGYHFLKEDMRSGYGVRQKPWEVGDRRSLRGGEIIPCKRGYHASPTLFDALHYAPGPIACLVELSGNVTAHGAPVDKYAARSRKLIAAVNVDRELRLFAADCAEHVLHLYEATNPDDDRPRQAIQAVRDYANGLISDAAWAAASAAAWDAARAAARDAARAAAWAAASAAARAAASDAAWAAAGDAARAAAWDAARDAEHQWQREQFDARFAGLFARGESGVGA